MKKQAYTVTVNLKIRVLAENDIDPNIDPEFDEATLKAINRRIKEEGTQFISENIEDFELDTESPYDPEFDE